MQHPPGGDGDAQRPRSDKGGDDGAPSAAGGDLGDAAAGDEVNVPSGSGRDAAPDRSPASKGGGGGPPAAKEGTAQRPDPDRDPLLTIVSAPAETKRDADAPRIPAEDSADANKPPDPARKDGEDGKSDAAGGKAPRSTDKRPEAADGKEDNVASGDGGGGNDREPPNTEAGGEEKPADEGNGPSGDDSGGNDKEPPKSEAGGEEEKPADENSEPSGDGGGGNDQEPPNSDAGGDERPADENNEPSEGDGGGHNKEPPSSSAGSEEKPVPQAAGDNASPNNEKGQPASPPVPVINASTEQAPPQPKPTSPSLPRHATRMMIVTDFWERMVNMQHALCALLLYALERDFSIVEPFVYESRAINEFSTPEHFRQQGMKPQPASLYFDLSGLFDTGHFVSHQTLRQRLRLEGQEGQFVVNAAVLVPWDDPRESHKGRKFYWCDDRVDTLWGKWKSSQYGRAVVPGFHVQRLLCLNPYHTMSPVGTANASYFDDLFAFVDAGTRHLPRACEECVAITMINYRKHLFDGVKPSEKRKELVKKSYPPVLVGKELQHVARRVAKEALGGKRYIGIQMRTGKPYNLLLTYHQESFKNSRKASVSFEKWLRECSASLVKRAKALAEELEGDGDVGFYMASDMVNSGWKGGEWANPEVSQLLNESLEYFKRELGDVHWFEPEKFGITQDIMGVSGAVDAAVVYFADDFVYSLPSSLGIWVDLQRENHRRSKAVVVDCNMPEFDVVEEFFLDG